MSKLFLCLHIKFHIIIKEGIHKAIHKLSQVSVDHEHLEEVPKEIKCPGKFSCGKHEVSKTLIEKGHIFIDIDFIGQNITT